MAMQQTPSVARATQTIERDNELNENTNDPTVIRSTPHGIREINVSSLYINETPFFDRPNDPRPYAKLTIHQVQNEWLIDTGSVACVIAYTDLDSILDLYGVNIRPTNIVINTVHTMQTPATGVVDLTFEFGEQSRVISTLLIKARKPQFIAGMNFCHAFDVALKVEPGFYTKNPNKFKSRDVLSTGISMTVDQTSMRKQSMNACPIHDSNPYQNLSSLIETDPNVQREKKAYLGRNKCVCHSTRFTNNSDSSQATADLKKPVNTSENGSETLVRQEVAAIEIEREDNVDAVEPVNLTPPPKSSNQKPIKYVDPTATLQRLWTEHNSFRFTVHTKPSDTGAYESAPICDLMEIVLGPRTQPKRDKHPGRHRRERLRAEKCAIMATELRDNQPDHIQTASGNDDTENDVLTPKRETVTQPHDLSPKQKSQLEAVLERFPYTPQTGPLNKTNSYVQHIALMPNVIPVKRDQYPLSPYVLEEVRAEIEKLLAKDIIEPLDKSPWRWPILWVKKKSGGGRICLDARGLNKLTIPDAYPSFNVDQILRNLPKAKYISGLDMTQAFHQIEIAPADRPKTAFAIDNKFYCYKRAVMGFRNSPADLTKMLATIFSDMTPNVYHYVDDFVILSSTFEEHLTVLTEVAKRLRAHNLTISREKSCFCYKRLSFLGYILTEDGLTANPERIQPILNYKRPTTVREVRRLVGLIGWYRRFLNKAAEKIAPLTDLIQKDSKRKVVWTAAAEEAFELIKHDLTHAPILVPADYSLPFKLYTDASLIAGAGILTQIQSGQERVIAYHSVKFSKTQQNYSATERECLAVLSAVEKFRPYIDGVAFTVVTDHASLKWLQNLKEPHGKLARWAVRLQAFDITFEHRPGKLMDAPDALSRAVDLIEIAPNTKTTDSWYNKIRTMAESGKSLFYKIENGRVYRRGKYQAHTGDRLWTLCVPSELKQSVLIEKHNQSCHMGYWKTLNSIQKIYYWKGMHADIYEYVTQCEICRQAKQSNENTRVPTGDYRDPIRPGRMLYIDFIGPLPASRKKQHMYAIVCIDGFSRYIFTKSFVRATAENTIEFLEKEVLFKFDTPEIIVSDHGNQFTSVAFRQFLEKYKIKHFTTGVYHPQSNLVEASNKVLKTSIRTQIMEKNADHVDWADFLPFITMKMNSTPLTSTHQSPFFTLHGRERAQTGDEHTIILDANPEIQPTEERMTLIHEAVANQSRTGFEENRKRYDTRARERKFKIGDSVYVLHRELSSAAKKISGKLNPIKKQAFISKIIGNDTYELIDSQSRTLGKHNAKDIMVR